MNGESNDDSEHIDAESTGGLGHVLDLDDVGGDETEDTDGRVPHDHGDDLHDELVHHVEEVVEDLRLALRVRDEYAEDDAEDDQTHDVHAVDVLELANHFFHHLGYCCGCVRCETRC